MSLIAIGLLFGLGVVTGVHAQAVAPVYGQCGGTVSLNYITIGGV